ALAEYAWPGNIRELENVIEHRFIIENSEKLTFSSLPDNVKRAVVTPAEQLAHIAKNAQASGAGLNYDSLKEQFEKEFIISALKANRGKINQTVAHANIPKN